MDILYVNKKGLIDPEIAVIEEITSKFAEKLNISYYKKSINVDPKLFVNVKKHASKPKENMRSNYSVHVKLEAPSILFSAHESDWDLKLALHKTFENLVSEVEHKFKDEKTIRKRTKLL